MATFEDMGIEFCKEFSVEDKEIVRKFALFTDIDAEILKSLNPWVQRYEEIQSTILRREVREKLLLN